MTTRPILCLVLLAIAVSSVYSQTTSQPFAALDRAVKAQRGGFAGDKSKLSAIFAAERRQLGDKFETELMKWLGTDVEKHYWISAFVEADSYLHGAKRLPQLALLIMEQGLSLAREKGDEKSQGYVVSLSFCAATLSAELGLMSLATSHKNEAEAILKSNSDMRAHVPALGEDEWRRYDSIPSSVIRPKPDEPGQPELVRRM